MGEEFTARPVAISISAFSVVDNPQLYGALFDGNVDVMRTIVQMPSIRRLQLKDVRLRENSVAQLGSLTNLEVLYLATNDIDGEWLRHLSNLKKLQRLAIRFNDIQDDDLKYLRELTDLEELHLDGTPVTAVGLSYLAEQKNLKRVSWRDPFMGLRGNVVVSPSLHTRRRLTEADSALIKASLPHCQILMDGPIQQLNVTY